MIRRLLRFDDLCPTMNWRTWDQIEGILDRHGLQPLLAVVPDNQDPKLRVGPENSRFWDRAREWQAKGWVIGQHGCRHVYDSREAGLVPWWRQSEFAGHPREVQCERLQEGRRRLEAEGLTPRVWIAPSHSFDHVTLEVLAETGPSIVSDGVGYRVYRDRLGLVWIPAQPRRLWPLGSRVETRIYHPNTLHDVRSLESFAGRYRNELMGPDYRLEHLVKAAVPRAPFDQCFERLYWLAHSVFRSLRQMLRPA